MEKNAGFGDTPIDRQTRRYEQISGRIHIFQSSEAFGAYTRGGLWFF